MALVRKAPALRILYGEEEKEPTFPTMNDPEIIEFYNDIITHGVYTALNKPRGKYNVRAHELISNYSNLFFALQQTEECPYITVSEMFFYKNFTEWTEFLKAAGEFFVTANTIIDKLIPDVTLNKDDINHVLALTGLLSTVLPNTARSEMPKLMRTISGYESGLLQEGGARSSSKAGFFDIKGGPHYVQRGGAWNEGDTNNESIRNEIKAEIRRRLSAHTPPLTEGQISGTCDRANTAAGAAEMRASMLADDRGERASGGAGAPASAPASVTLNFVVSDAGPASAKRIADTLNTIKSSMIADIEEMKDLKINLDNIEKIRNTRQYNGLSTISKKYLDKIIPWLIKLIKRSNNSIIERTEFVEFARVERDETSVGSIFKWTSRMGALAMTIGGAGTVAQESGFTMGAAGAPSWGQWGSAFISATESAKYNQQNAGFLAMATVEGSLEGYTGGLLNKGNVFPFLAGLGLAFVAVSNFVAVAFDDSPKEANFVKHKKEIKDIAKRELNFLLSSHLESCIDSLKYKLLTIMSGLKSVTAASKGADGRKGLIQKLEFNRAENINPTSLKDGIEKLFAEDIEALLLTPSITDTLDTIWPNYKVGTVMADQVKVVNTSINTAIEKLGSETAKKAETYVKKAERNSASMMTAISDAKEAAKTYIGNIQTSVNAIVKENKAIALTGIGFAGELLALGAGIPPGTALGLARAFGAAAGTSTAGVNALGPTVKNFSSASTGANLAAIEHQTRVLMARAALAEAEARLVRAGAPPPAAAPGFSAALSGFSAPSTGLPPPSGFPPPNASATGLGRGGRRHKTAHRSSRPSKKTTRKANKTHRSPMPV